MSDNFQYSQHGPEKHGHNWNKSHAVIKTILTVKKASWKSFAYKCMQVKNLLLATGGKQTPPPFPPPPLHPSTHTHTRAPSHRKLMKQNYLKLKKH